MYFSNVQFEEDFFSDADLTGSDFSNCTFIECNFTRANLSRCDFYKAMFHLGNFKNANIHRTSFKFTSFNKVKNIFSFTTSMPCIEQIYCINHDKGILIKLPDGGDIKSLNDVVKRIKKGYNKIPLTLIKHLKTIQNLTA